MAVYTGYLAVHKFEQELEKELQIKGLKVAFKKDRLYLVEGEHPAMIWAQVTGFEMEFIEISSIKEASKKLKQMGRNWGLFSVEHHRRAELIQSELPKLYKRPLTFRHPLPDLPMGLWTLWEQNLILATQKTTSPFPLGAMDFLEDKLMPPSRAYLKLWEFFTLHAPEEIHGGTSLDVGSSPGGWTWVLRTLEFHKIYSVDKAPIEKRILEMGKISFRQESAFALNPDDFETIDWFCSDIICYPDRLLNLVKRFLLNGTVKNFVCTIKYQGETDWENTLKFLEIPGSKIVHLHHNKHEVTWFLKGARK